MAARRGSKAQPPSRVNDAYGTREGRGELTRVEQQILLEQRVSGPLPSADQLERYNAIVPGMAERLLVNFEKQTDHRIGLEKRVIDGDVRRADRGLIFGWIFAMALLAASVYLIATGHEGIGVMGLLGELAVLGGSFIYADYRRRQERNRKAGG